VRVTTTDVGRNGNGKKPQNKTTITINEPNNRRPKSEKASGRETYKLLQTNP
jgi:hypothetical protein